MEESRALLTINLGNFLSANTRDSFKDACRRWNCDYVEITETDFPGHAAGLKLRAFDLCEHERILIIDADAAIRSDAPNIFEATKPRDFYAVKNQQPHYPPAYNQNIDIARNEIAAIFKTHGVLDIDVDWLAKNFFNSGFQVISRKYHKEILNLGLKLFTGTPLQWWDQMAINIAVAVDGGYTELPVTWNYQFPETDSDMQVYVHHYAGDPGRYIRLDVLIWQKVQKDT